jgi:putative N-acetyltransferase (TIGR04045 family)
MILESVTPYRSRDIVYKTATEGWELRAYRRLRRQIFSDEQGLFEGDDTDATDLDAIPIVAVTRLAGMPDEVVGVVRIWQPEPRLWWGGRLGTRADHRGDREIGPGLIHLAVGTACGHGCDRFLATVQVRNVKLFERLKWRVLGPAEACGVPHALMEADLTPYQAEVAA